MIGKHNKKALVLILFLFVWKTNLPQTSTFLETLELAELTISFISIINRAFCYVYCLNKVTLTAKGLIDNAAFSNI